MGKIIEIYNKSQIADKYMEQSITLEASGEKSPDFLTIEI